MWALTPEKVRCRAQGGELCNISYRCLTDSSGRLDERSTVGLDWKSDGFEGLGENMPQPFGLLVKVVKKQLQPTYWKLRARVSILKKYIHVKPRKKALCPSSFTCAIKGTISRSLSGLRLYLKFCIHLFELKIARTAS